MAGRPRRRAKLAAIQKELGIGGGGTVDSGLPVLSPYAQGGLRHPDLHFDPEDHVYSVDVRSGDGDGPRELSVDGGYSSMLGDRGRLCPRRAGNGGDGAVGSGRGLPDAQADRNSQQPDVSNRHRQPAGKATADDPVARVRERSDLLTSEALSEAAELSVQRALAILRIDPAEKDAAGEPVYSTSERLRLLALQKETLSAVLGTVAKVDDGRLRGKKEDRLGDLLAMIRAEEGRSQ